MKIRMAVIMGICLTVIMTMAGCEKYQAEEEEGGGVTVIPVTFLINPDTGENENEELVKSFNEQYEGTYQLKVEWISDTAEGYRSRIKTQNALDKLPAVITDVGFDNDFYELLIKNKRLVNLASYIEKAAEWKEAFGEREMENFLEKDGSIYLSPSANPTLTYAGFFYNKVLFQKAGIGKFPSDWDGFFRCLEKLKEKGIIPLALHGGSSYWTPLLIGTAYLSRTKEGMDFLNIQYPRQYRNDSVRDMFGMIKRLYDNADSDAIDIERTESAKRFAQGNAAITANGGWMIENFTEEEKKIFGFAPFPENFLMEDLRMSTWAVTSGYSEKVTKGAVEFLKFRSLTEQKGEEDYFATASDSSVEKEYRRMIQSAKQTYPNYQLNWENEIQEEFFVNTLPLYIEGELELEPFLEELDGAVKQINAEK